MLDVARLGSGGFSLSGLLVVVGLLISDRRYRVDVVSKVEIVCLVYSCGVDYICKEIYEVKLCFKVKS
jgi:hypothetical protein